jgi:hypothetical protein
VIRQIYAWSHYLFARTGQGHRTVSFRGDWIYNGMGNFEGSAPNPGPLDLGIDPKCDRDGLGWLTPVLIPNPASKPRNILSHSNV